MHWAAKKNSVTAITALVEAGAGCLVDAEDNRAITPLQLAAGGGYLMAVIELVKSKATLDLVSSPNPAGVDGTALLHAVVNKHANVVEYLAGENNHAKPGIPDSKNCSPLLHATINGEHVCTMSSLSGHH